MKKKMYALTGFFFIMIGAASIMITGCNRKLGKDKVDKTEKTAKMEETTDSIIETKVGKNFDIVVKSNPTTGFQWFVAEPTDQYVVKLANKEFIKDENADNMLGAGGKEVWTFEPVAEGEVTIRLVYKREWEDENIKREKKVQVKVTE